MVQCINYGGPTAELSHQALESCLDEFVAGLTAKPKKVLLIPPDFSRFHSGAGEICAGLYRRFSTHVAVDLLPALGTHRPMTAAEMNRMFPGVPHDRIRIHDWQKGLALMGEITDQRLKELSGGKVDYPVRIEVDRLVVEGGYDAIISVGQVVPHEVIGMAGGNKNILVGCAGPDTINKSHFLGAVCDMEKIMGRIASPVRSLLDEAEDRFLARLPIHYILTVRAKNRDGRLVTRGLFAGRDRQCFEQAAQLSQAVNIVKVPPLKKVVVFLDPAEFKSTWLGNKAIYRTRMAIADRGELLILAPGLVEFGEAEVNERVIRKYGYCGTEAVLKAVAADPDLRNSLGAAAHLIHGSSEGRFSITYASGGLKREDIEAVGFRYTDLASALVRYNPERLKDGFNTLPDGEEIYYISNPALGLWQVAEKGMSM